MNNLRAFIVVLISFCWQGEALTQVMTGQVGLQMEWYSLKKDDSTQLSRRIPFNYRMFLNPTINVSQKLSIPFSFSLSKRHAQAIYPRPINQTPIDYIKDPNNNVGVHPRFEWGDFHLGTHMPEYSQLSIGNLPIFGIGMDINPGKFRLAASYGYANWGLVSDTTHHIIGVNQRRVISTKIGIGKKDASGIYLNAIKITDLPNQSNIYYNDRPEEGAVLSSNFDVKVSSKIKWKGELALSSLTPNLLMDPVDVDNNPTLRFASSIIEPKEGSHADFSALSQLSFTTNNFNLGLNFKQIGAGFKSLAFPFQQSDLIDITISPALLMFKNKLILNGEFGYRIDNISGTKLSQSTNELIAINGNLTLSKSVNINANYNNFGIENGIDNDTLKVKFVSDNLGVSTNIRFETKGVKNSLILTYGKSTFEDLNTFTGGMNDNNTTSYIIAYSLSKDAYTIGFTGSKIFNNQIVRDIEISNYSLNLGCRIKNDKLKISTRIGLNKTNIIDENISNDQLLIRPKIVWKVFDKTSLTFAGVINRYKRSNSVNYSESLLTTGITSSF